MHISFNICLLVMIEKWKESINNVSQNGALMTDLTKVLNCLHYNLLLAKLGGYGFGNQAFTFVYSYLLDRQQRKK